MLAATVLAMTLAQTTTCQNTVYGMPEFGVTCRERPEPSAATATPKRCGALDKLVGFGDGDCAARAAAADRADLMKAVGSLAADGRCTEAQQSALRAGDLELAERIQRLCVAAPSPAR